MSTSGNTSHSFVIGHLRNRFHGSAALPARQCEQWLTALTLADGDALSARLTEPDEWLLIRHLPLAVGWRQDATDADVMQRWEQAFHHALEQAVSTPEGSDLVRYRNRREAIADLLYRSALGETARQWAWQRMDLIPRSRLAPFEVLQRGLKLLHTDSALTWPVLHRLIAGETATASLTALLRGLPTSDWLALLSACPRTASYARLLQDAGDGFAASADNTSAFPSDDSSVLSEEARSLLNWAAARSHFAARYSHILSVLIAALAWSSAGCADALVMARLQAVQAKLAALLGISASTTQAHVAAPASTLEARTPSTRSEDLPPVLPVLPSLPNEFEWLPTRCAGALFWLARVPASGIFEWLETQSLSASLPHMLHAIATALGVPDDDAAMRAFCGGEIPATSMPSESMPAAFTRRAEELVDTWSAWLDRSAPDLAAPRLASVCQRSGRLRFEPGWIELHLPLESVDTGIRRLGLDLDPGWLPWLACVLRIVYDE